MTAPERDPGLQPERTRLAWRRTTLACTVVAVLAARQATGDAWQAAGLCLAAWLGFLAVAHRRIAAMEAARPPALSLGGAVAAVACVLALAAFAVAIVT
ncbi:DUF202 domain-containing protein [Streptomyces sp. NPDC015127]|uniref:DUF202 domain-containing protein n=1 Tax=Streptomyces sp. NPDC015127 TaxID=3364939 RepID=UPI0036F7A108